MSSSSIEVELMVLSFVCFVLSDLLNRIWEDRGSSWQKLGCSGHLSSLHHQLVKHLSPQNVIFPVKMTPIHKVWSWSLVGQKVILTGAGMFRSPVSIVFSRNHNWKPICIGFGSQLSPEKFLVGGGGENSISPSPDHLILNWNRFWMT